jgi:hypothetical protein
MTEAAQGSAPAAPKVSAFPPEPGSPEAAAAAGDSLSPNAPGVKVDPVPTEAKEAAEKAIAKYKVKVNQQEREVDLDELMRGYTLGTGAHQKFDEAASMMRKAESMMRQVQSFQEMVQNDPDMIIKQTDKKKFRETAEKFLAQELRMEMMTPEEKQAYISQMEKDQKLAEYENKDKAAKEAEDKAKFNAMMEEQRVAYEGKFIEAFKSLNWPADTNMETKLLFMRDMATLLEAAVQSGYEPDYKDLAKMSMDSWMKQADVFYGSLDGERLVSALPANIAKKIRKYDLERLRATGVQTTPKNAHEEREVRHTGKKLNKAEWLADIRKRAGVDG